MSRRFRIALVWILTTVIPVYGMASVAMLLCAPAGRSAPESGAVHDAHGSSGHHAQHSTADTLHVLSGVGRDQPVDSTSLGSADDGAAHHHAGEKCSACAPCGLVVALPSAPIPMISPRAAGADFPPPLATAVEFVIAGPE